MINHSPFSLAICRDVLYLVAASTAWLVEFSVMSTTEQLSIFEEVDQVHQKFFALSTGETFRMPETTASSAFCIDTDRTRIDRFLTLERKEEKVLRSRFVASFHSSDLSDHSRWSSMNFKHERRHSSRDRLSMFNIINKSIVQWWWLLFIGRIGLSIVLSSFDEMGSAAK